ncbi:MAG: heavy metal translocating P-type ATPase [Gemmatimonadaceae bacterium]
MKASRESLRPALPLVWLVAGGIVALSAGSVMAQRVLFAGLVIAGAPLVWRTVRAALAGEFATDMVASLAVVAAMIEFQPLAGLVVVLMQTGGEALEAYAQGRASDAVRSLEEKAPRRAHRLARVTDNLTQEIDVGDIRVGDLLLVRPGEMIPCDGVVVQGRSQVDVSQITGEPMPLAADVGSALSSGCSNLDGALTIRATALARDSQYERIVELVRSAQAHKAPLQRLADEYARWFTPLTLAVCAIAWFASGDASRVLAVLVVATPCPLILATPVAIIGGINRAARKLIIVRTGGALEQLAGVDTVVFDKTGTLTIGRPAVSSIVPRAPWSRRELLVLAASVEGRSGHLLARSVVNAAADEHVALEAATEIEEAPGQGLRGVVGGRVVQVGARSWVHANGGANGGANGSGAAGDAPGLRAWIAVDGAVAGTIEFADQLRPGIIPLLAELRALGIERQLILSGDSAVHTAAIAAEVGIADARGELLPAGKVDTVRALVAGGARVLMVGDGTNDAPALSAATVGLALAGHGGGITAQAADAVILGDDIARVADAVRIGRRTMRIARESIVVGLGLSGLAMIAAATGHVAPVAGAVLQEVIDVGVILNALRASRDIA